MDCPDGIDEESCNCFVNGKIISNSTYCLTSCSLLNNCRCSLLFRHIKPSGCYSYIKYNSLTIINEPENFSEKHGYYSCNNSMKKLVQT